MLKIGVLLLAVCYIAYVQSDGYPTLMELDVCCYGMNRTTFDNDFVDCLAEHAQDQNPEKCASICTFARSKIVNMTTEAIDYDGLERLLRLNNFDDQLTRHIMLTVKSCEGVVGNMLTHEPYTSENKTCASNANLMRLCTASRGILDCPATKWQDNNNCKQILDAAKAGPFHY